MWAEGKSWDRVGKAIFKEGLFNNRTEKPFTGSAVQKSAMGWVLYNLEQAKKDFVYRQSRRGQTITEEDWKSYVAQMTRLFFSGRKNSMRKYIAQHGIQDYFANNQNQ